MKASQEKDDSRIVFTHFPTQTSLSDIGCYSQDGVSYLGHKS